jgi:hypothetical protein
MTTAKPPARFGAIEGARARFWAALLCRATPRGTRPLTQAERSVVLAWTYTENLMRGVGERCCFFNPKCDPSVYTENT